MGIHGDAAVRDDDIDAFTGGDDVLHVVPDHGQASTGDGAHDDGKCGAGSRVAVTAAGSHTDTVGVRNDVNVKIYIHLGGGQEYHVQVIDDGTGIPGISIHAGAHFHMFRISGQALDGGNVKSLGVIGRVEQAVF